MTQTVSDYIGGETPDGAPAPNLAHLSDEALLALVLAGDEPALGELYDRYGRVAYGLALRIVRDRALAEDAVQEAFLAVWRSAGAFLAEQGKPRTWILTLVHRRAVDSSAARSAAAPTRSTTSHRPTGEATDEEAWLRAQRQVVQEALRKLPPDQREAIELAYYGGFTQSELAERLGLPLGTIKSRMFTGLKRLRELLAESGLDVDAP